MSFDWVELGDFVKVQGGYAYKSDDFNDDGDFPVIKIKNVRFGDVDYSDASKINADLAEETYDWKTKEGDILISMTGSGPNAPNSLVGRVARIWEDEPDAWINQRVGRILLKEENEIHSDFIFYLLSSSDTQHYLVSNSTGSANQANISGKLIESVPCPNIEYETSKRIAQQLTVLDQKIHLNQQTNETLEAMAQAIFKSWFVDFDPVRAKIEAASAGRDPNRAAMAAIAGVSLDREWDKIEVALDQKLSHMTGEQRHQLSRTADFFPDKLVESEIGEVPKGWKIKSLDKIANYLNGRAMQKYPPEDGKQTLTVLKIAQLRKGDTEDADIATADIPDKFKIRNGDMIFSWSGSLLIRLWAGGDAALNQHLFKVTSKEYDQWFYYHWTKHHLDNFIRIAESKAVTMGHIKRSHLKEAKCAIPSSDLLQFGKTNIEPLLAQALQLKLESRNLAELRDTLLPKLISGELRLKNNNKIHSI